MKKNEQTQGNCGTLLNQSTYALWSTRRKREKMAERIFKEIMSENFPNLMQFMNLHFQEAQ